MRATSCTSGCAPRVVTSWPFCIGAATAGVEPGDRVTRPSRVSVWRSLGPSSGEARTLTICAQGAACQSLGVEAGTDEIHSVALMGQQERTSTTRLTFVEGEGECACDLSWGSLQW